MRYRLFPYRQGSKGAKALADALGGKVLKFAGSKFRPKASDVIINWGNTQGVPPGTTGIMNQPICRVLNDFEDIKAASNKRTFFLTMRDGNLHDSIPLFWTQQSEIPDDAFPVVCRTVLAGHSGEGIVIANTRDELVTAPLYVQYIKKKDEYRVHVGRLPSGGLSTIAIQRKARRTDVPDAEVNWKVRNHSNGFVFVRQGVNAPPAVLEAARNALGCIGLDFGAVDVIWNDNQQRAYVLEINTAPGLEGQTPLDYAVFFRNFGNVANNSIDVV